MAGLRSGALALLLLPGGVPPGERGGGERLPAGIAARLGDRVLTFAQFHAYLVERFADREEGKAALLQVARCRIVTEEAHRRGLSVSPETVRIRRAELERQLGASGDRGIESHLREQGIESEAFDELLRLTLLHESVVRADRGLPEGTPLAQEDLTKWLDARLEKIETRRPGPAAGGAATVAGAPVDGEEWGRNIRHLLPPERLKEFLLEAIGARLVEERARAQAIVPRPEDFEAEIGRRRARVTEDPKYMGASLEDLLRATGSSLEAVRRDPRTRIAVLLDRLVDRAFPPERLAEQFGRERGRLEADGEGRRISYLFLRTAEKPSGDVVRTFEQGEAELRLLAARCADPAAFAETARMRSEDDASKDSGGDLGVLHRGDSNLDPALLEAGFRAELGKVEGPIRLGAGVALLLVREKVLPPGEAALLERLREQLRTRLYREIVPQAPLTTYLD
ncbi:MAG TPA: peptidylprolyl isomerase [Planctomycetota bacterium]|nr:peptidylprolyl isomerase [Planctomycetota bacterium]